MTGMDLELRRLRYFVTVGEATPRYAREPVEFPHWASPVLGQGHLDFLEPGHV